MCCYIFVLHLPVFLIILQRLCAFLPAELFHCGRHSEGTEKVSFCFSSAVGAVLLLPQVSWQKFCGFQRAEPQAEQV